MKKEKTLVCTIIFSQQLEILCSEVLNLQETWENLRIFGVELKANMLSSNPCTIFEYNLGEDIQAKTEENRNIL